jgi:hypothetical protein
MEVSMFDSLDKLIDAEKHFIKKINQWNLESDEALMVGDFKLSWHLDLKARVYQRILQDIRIAIRDTDWIN